MAHYLTSDDKYRDMIYDDDYRSYFHARKDAPSDYWFGRTHGKRARVRGAFSRVNGYLKTMVEAIANAKLRRMERELELRGIRFDRSSQSYVARHPRPTERS